MSSKITALVLGLLAVAASGPVALAATTDTIEKAGGEVVATQAKHDDKVAKSDDSSKVAAADSKVEKQVNAETTDKPAPKKARRAKIAQKELSAKKQLQQPKKDGYESDRDRGLDIAHEYAPKTIDKVRKDHGWSKGDSSTPGTGESKGGWQKYVDKYYKGR
jgi:hypothetical protein